MQTQVGVNSPQAIKKWATALAVDYAKQLWFKKFIGRSEMSIVQEKIDLEQGAGDTVQFDLSMRLREKPTYGDNRLEGKEEALKFLQDEVRIDQIRKAASGGGRMTRKRTLHDLRKVAKDRTAEFCAEWMDEVLFIYASGDVGMQASNEDSMITSDDEFVGHVNRLEAPDADHVIYGGAATAKGDLAATDKMSASLIERCVTRSKMMNARNPDVVQMRPIKIGGEEHFVLLMNPYQSHDLRLGEGPNNWLEIQKAAGKRGSTNPIFTGQLGMVGNVSLHEHSNIRRYDDYGVGGNVEAARALFMGRQALTCAYGGGNKSRMTWVEKLTDYENEVSIAAGMICGVKKTRFKASGSSAGTDFGVIAVDTAASDPN